MRPKLAIVAAVALAVLVSGAGPAAADTAVTVNTTFDEMTSGDGTCSLREALAFASALPGGADCAPGAPSGPVTIAIPAGDYPLVQGVLDLEPVAGTVTIRGVGPGPAGTTIDAQHASPVLDSFGPVQLSGVTITGGQAETGAGGGPGHSGHAGGSGGGILDNGTLTLTDVAVTGNASGDGGTGGAGTSSNEGGIGGSGGLGGGSGTRARWCWQP